MPSLCYYPHYPNVTLDRMLYVVSLDICLSSNSLFLTYSLPLPQFFPQDCWTSLMYAATNGHLGVSALLLDRGTNIEAATNVIR